MQYDKKLLATMIINGKKFNFSLILELLLMFCLCKNIKKLAMIRH